jgi:hypothetical protein
MRRYFVVISLAVLFASCASQGGVTPKPAQVNTFRVVAAKSADGTTAGLKILNATSKLVDGLPVSTAFKDDIDCAIFKAIGIDNPSAAIQSVCGTVPTVARSPLRLTLVEIQSAANCPSLSAAVSRVGGIVNPLVSKLSASSNTSVAFAGIALKAAVDGVLEGGVTCSQ